MVKEYSLHYYLPKDGWRTDGFMPFLRALAYSEMQAAIVQDLNSFSAMMTVNLYKYLLSIQLDAQYSRSVPGFQN